MSSKSNKEGRPVRPTITATGISLLQSSSGVELYVRENTYRKHLKIGRLLPGEYVGKHSDEYKKLIGEKTSLEGYLAKERLAHLEAKDQIEALMRIQVDVNTEIAEGIEEKDADRKIGLGLCVERCIDSDLKPKEEDQFPEYLVAMVQQLHRDRDIIDALMKRLSDQDDARLRDHEIVNGARQAAEREYKQAAVDLMIKTSDAATWQKKAEHLNFLLRDTLKSHARLVEELI